MDRNTYVGMNLDYLPKLSDEVKVLRCGVNRMGGKPTDSFFPHQLPVRLEELYYGHNCLSCLPELPIG